MWMIRRERDDLFHTYVREDILFDHHLWYLRRFSLLINVPWVHRNPPRIHRFCHICHSNLVDFPSEKRISRNHVYYPYLLPDCQTEGRMINSLRTYAFVRIFLR